MVIYQRRYIRLLALKEIAIFFFQFLRLRMMQKQYMKKYFEYTRGERDYSTVYHQIPPPNAFEEPLRTKKNDFSDGHN